MSRKLGTRPWGVGGGVPRRGAEEKRVVAVRVPSGRRPGRMGAEEGGVLAIGGRFSPRNVGCWWAEVPLPLPQVAFPQQSAGYDCHRSHFLSSTARRRSAPGGRSRAGNAPALRRGCRWSPASPPQVARPFARCRLLPMQRMPAVVLVGYRMWQNRVGEF
jgi:hypothetical protein